MALALSKRFGGLSMAATDSESNAFPEKGLLLVGMGMGSLDGMTVEAQRAAKAADHRRYEAYTALWPDDELARLEEQVGSIQRVMRPEVEEPDELFTLAKNSLVALLVVGDPLQATTHVDLQLRAQDAGIDCRVIHGISITTVVTGACVRHYPRKCVLCCATMMLRGLVSGPTTRPLPKAEPVNLFRF